MPSRTGGDLLMIAAFRFDLGIDGLVFTLQVS